MMTMLLLAAPAVVVLLYAAIAVRWNAVTAYRVVAWIPLVLVAWAWLDRERLSYFLIVPLLAGVGSSAATTVLGAALLVRARSVGLGGRRSIFIASLACVSALPFLAGVASWLRDVGSGGPTTAFWQTMEIDPETLVVRFSGPRAMEDVLDAPIFFRFRTQSAYSVDHYAGWREDPQRVRYNAFAVDFDGRLRSRTKYQELLRERFGTVYGVTTYYYRDGERTKRVFDTTAYASAMEHEPPTILRAPPPLGGLRLDGASVVRVFRAPPEFLIVSANYDADGTIRVLHVNGAKAGDWVHPNEIGDPFRKWGLVDGPDTRAHYGLPGTFSVSRYEQDGATGFGETALEPELDVVHLHYDRNSLVRQDRFRPDGTRERRFLGFQITEQDRVLSGRDEAAEN